MKTKHICVFIVLALTALIICNPLFAADNPIVSKTNYIDGDIISVTLPPKDLNKQRFVGIIIPGSEELFLITDLNIFSLFDGQNLLSWIGQDKAIELEVTSDFPRGEYTVYLLQPPEGVVNPLEQIELWELGSTSFNIDAGIKPDTTAPTVMLTVPADAATGVLTNSKITATFSEAMDPATISTATFTLMDGVTSVSGTVTYSGVTAVFTPATDLTASATYTAKITTAAEDLAGNALASDYVWSFTTGATVDTTAPTVTLTNPVDAAIDVILSKKVQATFSEAMDPATISTATFTLMDGVTPVSGTVTYVGLVAKFTPTSNLAASTTYTAKITTAAEDLAGNALASDYVWSFTTVTAVALGPVPVDLGTAGNFVLLTKSGITTTGTTNITGDIGTSPIDSTGITGFGLIMDSSNQFATSALVTGNVYAADYAVPTPANMTTAISDMETAYTDAAGRTIPDFTELGAGDISGMDLVPGLYKWGTGVLIDLNGVTLTGGADDVWIFQIADDLTVQNGAIVTLAGGAQAKNVFWQVGGGTGVALGTTVQFQGIILATKAITMNTSATLKGRALAQTNVTLDANTITEP
ncbi:MAG: DUF3494 domain-containing protein [Deltaproteobacteria bacterium]|nr:DUF3494 domain-containing protein [Candidatus Desulfobacula maris]